MKRNRRQRRGKRAVGGQGFDLGVRVDFVKGGRGAIYVLAIFLLTFGSKINCKCSGQNKLSKFSF